MKKDLIVFDKYIAILNVSVKYDIKNDTDIENAKETIISNLDIFMEQRKSILVQNRDFINIKIRNLRKELKTVKIMKEELPRIKKILAPVTLHKKERDHSIER